MCVIANEGLLANVALHCIVAYIFRNSITIVYAVVYYDEINTCQITLLFFREAAIGCCKLGS